MGQQRSPLRSRNNKEKIKAAGAGKESRNNKENIKAAGTGKESVPRRPARRGQQEDGTGSAARAYNSLATMDDGCSELAFLGE